MNVSFGVIASPFIRRARTGIGAVSGILSRSRRRRVMGRTRFVGKAQPIVKVRVEIGPGGVEVLSFDADAAALGIDGIVYFVVVRGIGHIVDDAIQTGVRVVLVGLGGIVPCLVARVTAHALGIALVGFQTTQVFWA